MKKHILILSLLIFISGCEYSSKSENKISNDNGVSISSTNSKTIEINGNKIKTGINTTLDKSGLKVNLDNKATTPDFSVEKFKEFTRSAIEKTNEKVISLYKETVKKTIEISNDIKEKTKEKIEEIRSKKGE